MSDQRLSLGDPLLYAPKRIREAAQRTAPGLASKDADERPDPSPLDQAPGRDQSVAADGDVNLPRFLHAPIPRAAASQSKARPEIRLLRRPGRVAILAAGFATLALGTALAMWNGGSEGRLGNTALRENLAKQAGVKGEARELPKLKVSEPQPVRIGDAVPLGVSVEDLKNGGLVVVRGLAEGATISVGKLVDDRNWWLSAVNLKDAVIRPPPHFIGSMEVIVELRLANTSLSDRRSLRFEWVEPQAAKPAEAAPQPPAAPPRPLSTGASAALLRRGEDLIASGDVAAARLVLRRAAEYGNARAALLLANTYDPTMLEKLGVHGCSPDVATALRWYERAEELGSHDAGDRLKMLAKKNAD